MMRQSTRLMSFPAGTMVTVKGYPFVLRDAAAVMGTPENFGEAMCELAKAEQMEDQAMDGLKCDSIVGLQLKDTLLKAAKEVFEHRTKRRQAAGIEGKMVEQAT